MVADGRFEIFCTGMVYVHGEGPPRFCIQVIQQRQTGALDFFTNQGWEAYKAGFSSGQELWLGNVYINALTNQGTTYVMLVQTTDTTGQTYTANYAGFSMSSEATFYRAALGAYTGTTLGKKRFYEIYCFE